MQQNQHGLARRHSSSHGSAINLLNDSLRINIVRNDRGHGVVYEFSLYLRDDRLNTAN